MNKQLKLVNKCTIFRDTTQFFWRPKKKNTYTPRRQNNPISNKNENNNSM